MQDRFKLASLLCMAYALLIYPLSRLDELLPGHLGLGPLLVSGLLNSVSLLIFIYIFFSLKLLLNRSLHFNNCNKELFILMLMYVLHGAMNIGLVFTGHAQGFGQSIAAFLTVGLGISFILLGYQLKSEPGNVYGLGQWLSYMLMAVGACTVTVIWAKYGILLGVVAYLIMSVVFSRAEQACNTEQESTH